MVRLFKAVEIKSKKKKNPSKELMKETIKRGFIFSSEVAYNYTEQELRKLIKIIEEEVGLTAEKMNQSFHKSWQKIKEADLEQLVVEQIAHYLTTYGKEQPKEYLIEKEEQWGVDNLAEKIIELPDFESNKIQNENYIYIPKEALNIPDIEIDRIQLTVIKGYTKKELKEKLLSLLQSGIALGEETINDVVDIATHVGIDEEDIDNIKNKEVKIALYDYLKLFPENPIEFLRYVIYKCTGKTLLIKDKATIEGIKEPEGSSVLPLFKKYKKKHGLENLAQIFLRFKPLFLAFKADRTMSPTINKIRRFAKTHHKPMGEDYLNEVTAKIKKGERIEKNKLEEELSRVNTFRKIRLAYALKFRTKDVDSILYRIRNGKGYATDFSFEKKAMAKKILDVVMDSIVEDMKANIKGKKIYIPEYITYTLPATEKQFTGDFPSGSYVSIPKDMIVGIHWENVDGNMIDLDLSMVNDEMKIGWDSVYRTEDRNILFSGDITNAPKPKGATELFYIRKQIMSSYILFVNYYNYDDDVEVPFKIIVAKEQARNFKENYMVNPNNVMSIAKTKIDQKQKLLGLLVTTTNECRFYFAETYLGRSITSSNSVFVKNSLEYLFGFYRNTIDLNSLLIKAGGNLVANKDKCNIDLSPESLEKDKIINLIKP